MSRVRLPRWPRRGRTPDVGPAAAEDAASTHQAPLRPARPLVLVDGRMARRRPTGLATYIRELRHVLESRSAPDLRIEWVYGPPGLPRRGRLTSIGNLALDLLWLRVLLPFAAWRRRASLLHAPVTWGPWWSPCPTVVTIHDLAWERVPEAFPERFRRYARLFARRSVRTASRVIAVSESTARDLHELYGVPHERIRVVPNGVELDRRPPVVRQPFILSVGVLEGRKRIPALAEGHARYFRAAPSEPPPCRLVIVGGDGGEEEAVRAAAGPACEIRGFVRRDDLVELYRRATLMVYPSAYEGFGIPVAEAMAHGCPVLCARNSSLIELGGEAALFIHDADVTPEGIERALADALADREALAARGEAGRRQVERYSWPAAATATRDVYRQALGR
jgi:glycosyltransferase involved in cell wall biosynthesis